MPRRKRLYRSFLALCLLFGGLNGLFLTKSSSVTNEGFQRINTRSSKYLTNKKKTRLVDTYLIGPGDKIGLTIFEAEELSGIYTVLIDGTVNLPYIGSVNVNNLSLDQATQLITKLYSKQLIRPDLHLTIAHARPIRVSVLGETVRPGIYSLTSRETSNTEGVRINGLPTLIDAIQKSGGITKNANLKKVTLYRRLPGEKNQHKKTTIDILDLILVGRHSQNPFLFDGDIIKLAKADAIPNDVVEIASNTLSPELINVHVIGAVHRPGRLPIRANTPLIQAVLQAGGPVDWVADNGNIELVRINRNGTATRKRFKINLNEGVSNKKNPPLNDGDIVKVNYNTLAKISGGLGAITKPVSSYVNALALFKILNDSDD